MPEYETAIRMLEAVHEHVRSTGHEVICSDDPLRRMLGYACVECRGNPNLDDTSVWEVSVVAAAHNLPASHPLREYLRTQAGKERLLAELNRGATERFFMGVWSYQDGEQPVPDSSLWLGPEEEEQMRAEEARVAQAKEDYEAKCHAMAPDRFSRSDPLEPDLDPEPQPELRPSPSAMTETFAPSSGPWPTVRRLEDELWAVSYEDGPDLEVFNVREDAEEFVLELLRKDGLVS